MSTTPTAQEPITGASPVGSYKETRLNLSGVVKGKYTKTKNAKGEDVEEFVPETQQNKETGELELVTEDLTSVIEGSKGHKDILERHQKNGWPEPTVTKQQTFVYSEILHPDQVVPYFVSLGLDENQAIKSGAAMFQRGWAIAQQAEIRSFMTDPDQAEIAGEYSVAKEAAQPGERRQKDPMAAAAANLKKAGFDLSADQLRAFLATLNAPAAS